MPIDKDLGEQWRVREGPFPNEDSQKCFQQQVRGGTEWTTVAGVDTRGMDIGMCVAWYRMDTGQSLPHAIETQVNFPTKVLDTDNAVQNASTAFEFTCPRGKGGVYFVATMLQTGFTLAGGQNFYHYVRYGPSASTTNVGGSVFNGHASPNSSTIVTANTLVNLAEGDIVRVIAFQGSGASASFTSAGTNNFIQIARLTGQGVRAAGL